MDIFKYCGLKNISILKIITTISFLTGLLITLAYYNFSYSLKNIYLELKSNYTNDGKYLAVITKNGLWIKDIVQDKILMINSSKIESNYLIGNFITQFDSNFNVIQNIKSDKIDVSKINGLFMKLKYLKKMNTKLKNFRV